MDDARTVRRVSGTEILLDPVNRGATPRMPAHADMNQCAPADDVREPVSHGMNQPALEAEPPKDQIERPRLLPTVPFPAGKGPSGKIERIIVGIIHLSAH